MSTQCGKAVCGQMKGEETGLEEFPRDSESIQRSETDFTPVWFGPTMDFDLTPMWLESSDSEQDQSEVATVENTPDCKVFCGRSLWLSLQAKEVALNISASALFSKRKRELHAETEAPSAEQQYISF